MRGVGRPTRLAIQHFADPARGRPGHAWGVAGTALGFLFAFTVARPQSTAPRLLDLATFVPLISPLYRYPARFGAGFLGRTSLIECMVVAHTPGRAVMDATGHRNAA